MKISLSSLCVIACAFIHCITLASNVNRSNAVACTDPDVPGLAASALTICSGSALTLSIDNGNLNDATDWQWYSASCGGTPEGNGTSITVMPTTTTTYYARGEGGCVVPGACGSISITVNTSPVVSLGADVSQCGGNVLLDAGNPGAVYAWSPSGTTQTITALSTGTYSVLVTDANNCTGSDSKQVTIFTIPVVTITGNPDICTGGSTVLTGVVGGTRQWYRNGQVISGATAVTYTATTAGIYNMIKTNTNGCSDSAATGLTTVIRSLPVVSLGSDVTQCGGNVVLDAGNPGAMYAWSPAATTQIITALSTNTYSVVVTNAYNCTGSDLVNITIHTNPVVNLGADITQCGGNMVLNAGNPGAMYAWSPSGTTQIITALSTGTYSVLVTDVNSCTGSDAISITINTIPVVTITGNSSICAGGSTVLTGVTGGTRQWYRNGQIIPGATAVTYTATTAGIYNMIKTNTNGCADSAAVGLTVVVNALPVVNLGADITQCGGNVVLNAGNPGATYAWSPSGSTQVITALATNTYSVVVTDANNCSGSDEIAVTINTVPVVTLSGNPDVCAGSSTVLTGVTGGTRQWYRNGQTIAGATAVTYTAATAGVYNMIKTNTNGCSDSAATGITVVVHPLPTATVSPNTTICAGTSAVLTVSGGIAYQWGQGGQTTSSIMVSPTASTTYTVTVSDPNGCSDTALVTVTVDPCTGISTIGQEEELLVYPNPVSGGVVTVQYAGKIHSIELYNLIGQMVYARQNLSGERKAVITLPADIEQGIYFLKVRSANFLETKKIIVQ